MRTVKALVWFAVLSLIHVKVQTLTGELPRSTAASITFLLKPWQDEGDRFALTRIHAREDEPSLARSANLTLGLRRPWRHLSGPTRGFLLRGRRMKLLLTDINVSKSQSSVSPLRSTGDTMMQVVRQYLRQCLLVLRFVGNNDQGLKTVLRKMGEAMVPTFVLESPADQDNITDDEGGSSSVRVVSGCAAHILLLDPGADGAEGGADGAGGMLDSLLQQDAPVTAPRNYLFILAPYMRNEDDYTKTLLLHPRLPRHMDTFLLQPPDSQHPGVSDNVVVYGRCLHCEGGTEGVRVVARWAVGGLTHISPMFQDHIRDFHGHVFHTVTMDFAPFIDYTRTQDDPGGLTTPTDSMDVRILKEAARALNFSFILREPSDGQWGYLLENGSWTGTVGTVQRGEADFSMMLSITWERTYAVSFTRAYYVEPMTFVTRKPGPLPQWQAPIKPFHWVVWLLLVASVTMAGPALWVLLRLSPSSSSSSSHSQRGSWEGGQEGGKDDGSVSGKDGMKKEEEEAGGETMWNLNFGEMFFYMLAPIFAEPVRLLPRSSSSRVLCGLWWLFCILTTTLYRGSLIARLTFPTRSPSLNTLDQLASSDLEWGMLDTYGSGYQLFKSSTVPVYQTLFQKMQYHNMRYSMERVLGGNYAFISWKTYFRNLIARDYTDRNGATLVHIAREDFFPGGFGWAFPKDSPYLVTFDEVFQRMIESGLIQKWMTDLIQLSARENREDLELLEPEVKGPQAFTIYHLQGIFFIMMGGFLLTLLAFLGETLKAFLSPRTML
ncbi:ionotropic receptor 21a-like isoform X1 [Homarus americanus]|uniref:ionotropic receptor 21a-like isoform X1 n=1 Tax=Homarus americanus TaxID=6706 RepID=UPI001C4815B6|nr:ionotropic receptor 21a-like isoform X1 [Homarus americanus]